ncbi:MAG: acyltransferase [Rhodobacterales bacterium]|nr:MAG: acyltransferase [Rhodobacterales bacterium]
MKYRPEIDGLRTVAVIPVILYHAGAAAFSGGFVGVDVFFVISGYLITTILIGELEQGRFSIINFYERRARRILPALFFVMLCTLPFAWVWMLPGQLKDYAQSLIAVSLFGSNFLFWKTSGYFAAAAEEKPFLHTWSLAVEEQYYVLFPVFLFLAWRFGRNRVFWMIAVFAAISLLVSEWGWRNEPKANFFLFPTRAWELFAGSIAAFVIKSHGIRSNNLLSAAGLLAILFSIFVYTEETPFPSVYALLPVGGSVLIVLYATRDTLAGRLLSTRPFVGIGLISYSAYLWHQPLFAFARIRSTEAPGLPLMLLLSVVALGLAGLSWRYVERPFRLKDVTSRRLIFSGALTGIVAFAALGWLGNAKSAEFEQYWLARQPENVRATYTVLARANPELSNWGADEFGNQNLGDCRFNARNPTGEVQATLKACAETYGPGVLVLGDSHAMDLYGTVASRFADHPFIVGITQGGCRVFDRDPDCHYDDTARFVAENPGVFGKVIFEQAGVFLLREDNGTRGTREMFSRLRLDQPVEHIEPDPERIGIAVDYVRRLSQHVPVQWFLPRVEPHIASNYVLRNGCEGSYFFRENQVELFDTLERVIAAELDAVGSDRLTWVSQNALFGFDLAQDFMSCDEIFWSDGDHFSETGEVRFGARLPEDFVRF